MKPWPLPRYASIVYISILKRCSFGRALSAAARRMRPSGFGIAIKVQYNIGVQYTSRALSFGVMPKRKRELAPGEGVIDYGANSDSVAGTSSPSQQHAPQTSLPRTKRVRKDLHKDTLSAVPEKRGAILKKSCPKNILDRVARVKSQR